ncbi:hypothetical protein [Paenibacillus sp. 22594]|uniref:hypothetical protein n=1 Tax=Paenibacillus sp. 22594 TaxID=3453947 RepID=UPI003F85632B
MQATEGATPDPTRFLRNLRLFVSLMVTAFFQIFFTPLAGAAVAILMLFSPHSIFWGNSTEAYSASDLLWMGGNFLLAGGAFALLWLGYWWMLYGLAEDRHIRLFPLHVLFAYFPLLFFLYQIDPGYDPMAMIVGNAGESTFMVCMAMTLALLFPLYSFGVYYFVLRPAGRPRKRYRFTLLCMVFAVIAIALLPVLWHIAPQLYPGLLEFPN